MLDVKFEKEGILMAKNKDKDDGMEPSLLLGSIF